MLTQVVNAPGLVPFLLHYRQCPIYFRFLPTAQYSTDSLRALRGLVLRLQQGGKLVYDEIKDVKRYSVMNSASLNASRRTPKYGSALT